MIETFKAEERVISYLFTDNKKYTIPRNQRDYVWDRDNLEDFWDDIYRTIEVSSPDEIRRNEYFIGSCVIMIDKKNNREILDGQQRITTILILLSAIAQKFKILKEEKLFNSTYKYIRTKDNYGEDYFVLTNPKLDPFFSERILCEDQDLEVTTHNEEQQRIEFAYLFFEAKINELETITSNFVKLLTTLRDQILDLKIVEICVATEVDGYTVFEILNARGKELELHDKLKNWCMRIKPNNYTIDKVKRQWSNIIENVEASTTSKNSFGIFINHLYIAKYDKYKNDRELYKRSKKEITKETLNEYLNSLIINSENYAYFSRPKIEKCESIEEFRYLEFFKNFRITLIRPVLLALYQNLNSKNITHQDLVKYLKKLYDFHSIYTAVSKRPTNSIEGIYNQHASILYNNCSKSNLGNLMRDLKKVLPNYSDFERDFISKKFSNKTNEYSTHSRTIKHIISSIELHFQESDELQINTYTIEHILSDDASEVNSSIGNLIPLSKRLNEKAENFDLNKKNQYYKESKFETVLRFVKYHGNKEKWTAENINDRSKKLAKLCYESIWKIE